MQHSPSNSSSFNNTFHRPSSSLLKMTNRLFRNALRACLTCIWWANTEAPALWPTLQCQATARTTRARYTDYEDQLRVNLKSCDISIQYHRLGSFGDGQVQMGCYGAAIPQQSSMRFIVRRLCLWNPFSDISSASFVSFRPNQTPWNPCHLKHADSSFRYHYQIYFHQSIHHFTHTVYEFLVIVRLISLEFFVKFSIWFLAVDSTRFVFPNSSSLHIFHDDDNQRSRYAAVLISRSKWCFYYPKYKYYEKNRPCVRLYRLK